MCAPTVLYLLVANFKIIHVNKISEQAFFFLIEVTHQQPSIISWKVEVIDRRLEGRRDNVMKTTHDTRDRFVVNEMVGQRKTVAEIWFLR
jgi:hypothetical protein